MILEVVSGQPFVTLLRPAVVGKRHFGVPPGGPFDRRSAQIAASLLRNAAEVHEVTIAPSSFRVLEPGAVGLFGGAESLRLGGVSSPAIGGFRVRPGEIIEVGPAILGARTYVAASSFADTFSLPETPRLPQRGVLRVVAAEQEVAAALKREWTVTVNLDRRGIRVESGYQTQGRERPSEMVVPGAIQITPDGTAILLGPDGPTIGGYPVAAVVIDADLDLAGQLMPGERVRFQPLSIAEALSARRTQSSS